MYSLRNVLTQEPANISGALIGAINALLIFMPGIDITVEQLGILNTSLVLVLNVFYVRPLTASKNTLARLKESEDDAFLAGAAVQKAKARHRD